MFVQLGRKPKRKDQRTYKNFKYWPTEKLKEVIYDEYHRGSNGADYDGFIDEIKEVYYIRQNRIIENNINSEIELRG